jgi:FtsZ-binding cell division protein ZapB
MNFDETRVLKKEIKELRKRVPTLQSDIQRVKPKLEALYVEREELTADEQREFREQFFSSKKATRLDGSTEEIDIIKMRLDTDTDQYRTKLRLVCIAIRQGKQLLFVELYSKNDKDYVNSSRIKKYL